MVNHAPVLILVYLKGQNQHILKGWSFLELRLKDEEESLLFWISLTGGFYLRALLQVVV